jgi:hypothetical protein
MNSQGNKFTSMITGILSRLQSMSQNETIAAINFENGKITGKGKSYLNDEMNAVYAKNPFPALNTSLARRLPVDGKLMALMMASINTEAGKMMMKNMGLNDLMDSIKTKIPFDINLLTKAFGNDALIAVMNVKKRNDDVKVEEDGKKKIFNGLEVIAAFPVKDKEKFAELRSSVNKFIDSIKHTEKGEKFTQEFNPAIKYNDSLCVIAMTENAATDFLNSPAQSSLPEWLPANSQYPTVMNLNIKELLSMLILKNTGESKEKDEDAMKVINIFDQMIATNNLYADGALHSHMEFRFGNTNDNAMKQLFDLINYALVGKKRNYEGVYDAPMADTSAVAIEAVPAENVEPPPPPRFTPPKIVKEKPAATKPKTKQKQPIERKD